MEDVFVGGNFFVGVFDAFGRERIEQHQDCLHHGVLLRQGIFTNGIGAGELNLMGGRRHVFGGDVQRVVVGKPGAVVF